MLFVTSVLFLLQQVKSSTVKKGYNAKRLSNFKVPDIVQSKDLISLTELDK